MGDCEWLLDFLVSSSNLREESKEQLHYARQTLTAYSTYYNFVSESPIIPFNKEQDKFITTYEDNMKTDIIPFLRSTYFENFFYKDAEKNEFKLHYFMYAFFLQKVFIDPIYIFFSNTIQSVTKQDRFQLYPHFTEEKHLTLVVNMLHSKPFYAILKEINKYIHSLYQIYSGIISQKNKNGAWIYLTLLNKEWSVQDFWDIHKGSTEEVVKRFKDKKTGNKAKLPTEKDCNEAHSKLQDLFQNIENVSNKQNKITIATSTEVINRMLTNEYKKRYAVYFSNESPRHQPSFSTNTWGKETHTFKLIDKDKTGRFRITFGNNNFNLKSVAVQRSIALTIRRKMIKRFPKKKWRDMYPLSFVQVEKEDSPESPDASSEKEKNKQKHFEITFANTKQNHKTERITLQAAVTQTTEHPSSGMMQQNGSNSRVIGSILAEDYVYIECPEFAASVQLRRFSTDKQELLEPEKRSPSFLQPHQRYAERIFVPDHPNRGFSLFYNVGSGKTCAAISCLTKYWIPRGYNVLWVSKKSIQAATLSKNNYYEDKKEQSSLNPSRTQFVCNYQMRKHSFKGGSSKKDVSFELQQKLFKSFFHVVSYATFFSTLLNKLKSGSKKIMVVFDEAHMRYTDQDLNRTEYPKKLPEELSLFYSNQEIRFLALTATPVTPSPYPLICLMNLSFYKEQRKQLYESIKKKGNEAYLQRILDIKDEYRKTEAENVRSEQLCKRQDDQNSLMQIHLVEDVQETCNNYLSYFADLDEGDADEVFTTIFKNMYAFYTTDNNMSVFPKKQLVPVHFAMAMQDETQARIVSAKVQGYVKKIRKREDANIDITHFLKLCREWENYAQRSTTYSKTECQEKQKGKTPGKEEDRIPPKLYAEVDPIDKATNQTMGILVDHLKNIITIEVLQQAFANIKEFTFKNIKTKDDGDKKKRKQKQPVDVISQKIQTLLNKDRLVYFGEYPSFGEYCLKNIFGKELSFETLTRKLFNRNIYKSQNNYYPIEMVEYAGTYVNAIHAYLKFHGDNHPPHKKLQNLIEKVLPLIKKTSQGDLKETLNQKALEEIEKEVTQLNNNLAKQNNDVYDIDSELESPNLVSLSKPGKPLRALPKLVDHFDTRDDWMPSNSKKNQHYFQPRCFANRYPKYSAKLAVLARRIHTCDEEDKKTVFVTSKENKTLKKGLQFKHAIYCKTNYTAKVVVSMLTSLFSQGGDDKTSFVMELNQEQNKWIVPEDIKNSKSGNKNNNRIALLTKGSVAGVSFTNENETDILRLFNDRQNNVYGENCRFMVFTEKFSTGVDLFDVRHCHLFDTPESEYLLRQVMGRTCRLDKQPRMPLEVKEVTPTVYYHRYQTLVRFDPSSSIQPHKKMEHKFLRTNQSFDLEDTTTTKTFQDWCREVAATKERADQQKKERVRTWLEAEGGFMERMAQSDGITLNRLEECNPFPHIAESKKEPTRNPTFADHRRQVETYDQENLHLLTKLSTEKQKKLESRDLFKKLENVEIQELLAFFEKDAKKYTSNTREHIIRNIVKRATQDKDLHEQATQLFYKNFNAYAKPRKESKRTFYGTLESEGLLGTETMNTFNVNAKTELKKEDDMLANVYNGEKNIEEFKRKIEFYNIPDTTFDIDFKKKHRNCKDNKKGFCQAFNAFESLLSTVFAKSLKSDDTRKQTYIYNLLFDMLAISVVYTNESAGNPRPRQKYIYVFENTIKQKLEQKSLLEWLPPVQPTLPPKKPRLPPKEPSSLQVVPEQPPPKQSSKPVLSDTPKPDEQPQDQNQTKKTGHTPPKQSLGGFTKFKVKNKKNIETILGLLKPTKQQKVAKNKLSTYRLPGRVNPTLNATLFALLHDDNNLSRAICMGKSSFTKDMQVIRDSIQGRLNLEDKASRISYNKLPFLLNTQGKLSYPFSIVKKILKKKKLYRLCVKKQKISYKLTCTARRISSEEFFSGSIAGGLKTIAYSPFLILNISRRKTPRPELQDFDINDILNIVLQKDSGENGNQRYELRTIVCKAKNDSYLTYCKKRDTKKPLWWMTKFEHELPHELEGLKVQTIKGDGNCFFRAVSHQLYGTQEHHKKLRQDLYKYLNDEKNQDGKTEEEKKLWQDMVKESSQIGKPGVWVDSDVHVYVMSSVIKRPIQVFSTSESGNFRQTLTGDKVPPINPINLHLIAGRHYESLVKDPSAGLPVEVHKKAAKYLENSQHIDYILKNGIQFHYQPVGDNMATRFFAMNPKTNKKKGDR